MGTKSREPKKEPVEIPSNFGWRDSDSVGTIRRGRKEIQYGMRYFHRRFSDFVRLEFDSEGGIKDGHRVDRKPEENPPMPTKVVFSDLPGVSVEFSIHNLIDFQSVNADDLEPSNSGSVIFGVTAEKEGHEISWSMSYREWSEPEQRFGWAPGQIVCRGGYFLFDPLSKEFPSEPKLKKFGEVLKQLREALQRVPLVLGQEGKTTPFAFPERGFSP